MCHLPSLPLFARSKFVQIHFLVQWLSPIDLLQIETGEIWQARRPWNSEGKGRGTCITGWWNERTLAEGREKKDNIYDFKHGEPLSYLQAHLWLTPHPKES